MQKKEKIEQIKQDLRNLQPIADIDSIKDFISYLIDEFDLEHVFIKYELDN